MGAAVPSAFPAGDVLVFPFARVSLENVSPSAALDFVLSVVPLCFVSPPAGGPACDELASAMDRLGLECRVKTGPLRANQAVAIALFPFHSVGSWMAHCR